MKFQHTLLTLNFGKEDWFTYINSADELAAYYSEYGTDGKLNRMKETVFLNEKYNEAFFQEKCLMLYYHFEDNMRVGEYKSITLYDNALTINFLIYSKDGIIMILPALAPTHIVIELDKQYSGMDASLNWIMTEIE